MKYDKLTWRDFLVNNSKAKAIAMAFGQKQQLGAKEGNQCQTRENASDQVMIGIGLLFLL